MSDEALEGIRREATEAWLAAHVPGLRPPFAWERLTGGTSNLTYAVSDASGRRVVVRRPPTGKLLPKAHDMGREFKILSALAPTPVPVARPFAHCTDPEVTGAPFYVMEFRSGHTIRTTSFVYHPLPEAARARVGASIVEALVALHALEPEAIGLGDLGRPDAYVARQLDRWMKSWSQSQEAARIDLPVDDYHRELSARIPEQGPGRVVHGDVGPHNMLIDDDGELVALTDWEISTLGAPLADLAYFTNGWAAGLAETDLPYEEGRLHDGYATRRELIEAYAKGSGRDLSALPYYVAFNYFKTTCIFQGVYARFLRGVRSTQGLDLDGFRAQIEACGRSTEQALVRL